MKMAEHDDDQLEKNEYSELPPKHGQKWNKEDVNLLLQSILMGEDWESLSEKLGRKKGAIMRKFGNIIIHKINNKKLAQTLLSTAGSSPPPNDPRLSISGVGSTPPDDRCPTCSHPLGPRCETCGNCLQSDSVKISKEDFFLSNNSLYEHDINIDLDDLGQRYIDIKLKYEINQQTENERLREWVWDYIESMGGKIDREKIRREQPLEDYEYYKGNGDEDDHK